MHSCAIIRTNELNEEVNIIRNQLLKYFNSESIYILIEDYIDDSYSLFVDGNNISVGRGFLEEKGLKYFPRAGWQCGDYILYAAYEILKDKFDYFWITEPDLRLNIDVEDFFKTFESKTHDLVGIHFGYRQDIWSWYNSMSFLYEKISGLYFPFLRISGRAIEFLCKKRSEYKNHQEIKNLNFDTEIMIQEYANDEAFVGTTLRNNGFDCVSLNKYADDYIKGYFSTEFPILEQETNFNYAHNKILHPVLNNWDRIFSKLDIIYNKYPIERVNKRVSEMLKTELTESKEKKLKCYLR